MNVDPVAHYIEKCTNSAVQSGVFRNMRLSQRVSWSQIDRPSKLLGTYEEELHPFLRHFCSRNYGCIIDVGCAEGYYAVGLALMFPKSKILAYDINSEAHSVCAENAELNGVSDRVAIGGFCDPTELRRAIRESERSLVLCDCEGYEVELFEDDDTLTDLALTDLIIECHDFIKAGTTAKLAEKFGETHRVSIVLPGPRDPNKFPFLAGLQDAHRWRSICEFRPSMMSWIVCQSNRY